MKTSDFDYVLPAAAVAQQPLERRDSCRMALLPRAAGPAQHLRFHQLPQLLRAGDCLVLNNSRVLPSRIHCVKEGSGGRVELLLLRPEMAHVNPLPCFARPRKRLRAGTRLLPQAAPPLGSFVVEDPGAGPGPAAEPEPENEGRVLLRWEGAPLTPELLGQIGLMPLPPYIQRDTHPDWATQTQDRLYYQSVYARRDGSCAAPTAGLHFTQGVLSALLQSGIEIVEVTLHVGPGTFLPVKTEQLEEHPMHEELYQVSAQAAQRLNRAKSEGRRIIAAGTTSLRTLESCLKNGVFEEGEGSTRLFIKPGDAIQSIDGLLTNFHQPRSTLLALVSAFAGRERILELYNDCLERNYRFLSYGDCMLII